jgi:thiol:disulfide interchange protein DsbG
MHSLITLIALILLTHATAATAAGAQQIPPVLQSAQSRPSATLEVLNEFSAPSGLSGWLVNDNGTERIIYTTPDGKTLLIGALLDEQMKNLTAEHEQVYRKAADLSSSLKLVSALRWFKSTAKDNAPIVYVFVDMNCAYCAQLWEQFGIVGKSIEFRLVPVAILGERSLRMASGLLSAEDPMDLLERHFTQLTDKADWPEPTESATREILRNTAVMNEIGLRVTPSLILSSEGRAYARQGVMTAAELERLMGL